MGQIVSRPYILVRQGILPRSLILMAAIANTANRLQLEITVIAGRNGNHPKSSRHLTHEALDIQTSNLTIGERREFITMMQAKLGSLYDVVMEDVGTEREHLHVGYFEEPVKKEKK